MKDIFTIDESAYRSIPLFSELNDEELNGILSFSAVKKYKKTAPVFFEGDPYAGFYVVLKGSVKVYKNTPDGKEFVIHLLHPYSLFAEFPMFEGGNYPANAQALENTVLLFVPKWYFAEYVERSP